MSESVPQKDKTAAQAELLFNRLAKRYKHLKKWAKRINTNAFRLYDRDIPEIPLVLDLYGGAVSGALYKRPYEKEEAEEELWLLAMKSAAAKALGINENNIFLKERRRLKNRQEKGNQYERIQGKSFYNDIYEGDLKFRVNLSDYIDSGLFLDARKKREWLRSEAEGKRVLNLFAYTCSLSLAALKGRARRVDSVDLSNTYLEWGRINFALNNLETSPVVLTRSFFSGKENSTASFVRGDVFEFIKDAYKNKLNWDLIILDPPSFSNSKRMRSTLDLKRDYGDLIRQCLAVLAHNGTLLFSSNAKSFNIAEGDFSGLILKDLRPFLLDEDFKGKNIPVCYEIKNADKRRFA